MPTIDLTKYVTGKTGTWFNEKAFFRPDLLKLRASDDSVTLHGPARLRITVQAHNALAVVGTSTVVEDERDVYSYVLDIPPGRSWTYRPSQQEVATGLGSNAGFGVKIEPAGPDICSDPCAPDPCKLRDPCDDGKKQPCGCGGGGGGGCRCGGGADTLPCDFAKSNRPDAAAFFPSACEPCTPGASIGMPPQAGASLLVGPAQGGTVRTRYFNGMFVAREDLETDQRNVRLKRALMNRALGQGVVWGLGLARDGEALCVMPGYAVDCCGNDLVLSQPYRVDASLLVRDPAAAQRLSAGRGPQRMHLMLEYYECPQDPRPVHGDICAPGTARCEMARVRETVRLRLVPPCEVDTRGPLKDLLDTLGTLKGDRAVARFLEQPRAMTSATASPLAAVPFTFVLSASSNASPADPQTGNNQRLQPAVTGGSDATATMRLKPVEGSLGTLQVVVEAHPGFDVVDADLKHVSGVAVTVKGQGTQPGKAQWEVTLPQEASAFGLQAQWRMRRRSDQAEIVGTTPVAGALTLQRRVPTLSVVVKPTDVRVVVPPRDVRFPCMSEACDPEGKPRFPIAPPWLHEDPLRPGQPGDPRALMLAAVYAYLAMRTAQAGPSYTGTSDPQVTLATAIYAAVWKAFYGEAAAERRNELLPALQKLFQAWCRTLLYPGPECECDPHGVVIGCATVEGGAITHVDPWGGRRWVVHYPLLAHWGKQFGITPPDAIASKLFDIVCCIGALPVPGQPVLLRPGTPDLHHRAATPSPSELRLGPSALLVERRDEARRRARSLGAVREERLGPVDFIGKVLTALELGDVPEDTPRVHYSVMGLPELHLVSPVLGLPREQPGTPGPAPTRPSVGNTRVAELARAALETRAGGARKAPPALLRGVGLELAVAVVHALPLDGIPDLEAGVVKRLARGGVPTVGALLDADAEAVHARVLEGEHAQELDEALRRSEEVARTAARSVWDAVAMLAADRRLSTRADLQQPALADALFRALRERLVGEKLSVDDEALRSAVGAVAG